MLVRVLAAQAIRVQVLKFRGSNSFGSKGMGSSGSSCACSVSIDSGSIGL